MNDVDGQRRKRDAHGKRIDRGGDGEHQILSEVDDVGVGTVVRVVLVIVECHPEHLATDDREQDESDPVVDRRDQPQKLAAQRPTDNRHERLKSSEKEREHDGDFEIDALHAEPLADRHRKGVHRKAYGD